MRKFPVQNSIILMKGVCLACHRNTTGRNIFIGEKRDSIQIKSLIERLLSRISLNNCAKAEFVCNRR